MRKLALLATMATLATVLLAGPPASAQIDHSPYGQETNAIGTARWLPDNANEKVAGANRFRLVVVYDASIGANGAAAPLLAKGPFGAKFFTANPDVRMKAHSPRVTSLDEASGRPEVLPADEAFVGVAGDVRDGQCSKLGTPTFSAAYSTTRSFFVTGTTPYAPVSAPGACEVVDSSVARADGSGFDTKVTTFVPGFWIDVEWITRAVPVAGTGRVFAELWYSTFYDTGGENGEFYEVGDATSHGTSISAPGDYDVKLSFSATPGAIGAPCEGLPNESPALDGSWQDIKVQVPDGTTKVIFKLFPKADWDMVVDGPEGYHGTSGAFPGFDETITITGTEDAPVVPGEYTMRACNWIGEPTVAGGVILQ